MGGLAGLKITPHAATLTTAGIPPHIHANKTSPKIYVVGSYLHMHHLALAHIVPGSASLVLAGSTHESHMATAYMNDVCKIITKEQQNHYKI